MAKAYLQAANTVEHTYEIKKSAFIARVSCVEDRAQAMAFLAKAREDYPDARHHCWAYLLGSPVQPSSQASSDDGEPSGTAGKPILNVLNHKDIGDIMVVVIRYFGGIKLGAGGLVRAYSTATQQAIEQLALVEKKPLLSVLIKAPFAEESQVRYWLARCEGLIDDVSYSSNVGFTCRVPETYKADLNLAFEASEIILHWQDDDPRP